MPDRFNPVSIVEVFWFDSPYRHPESMQGRILLLLRSSIGGGDGKAFDVSSLIFN